MLLETDGKFRPTEGFHPKWFKLFLVEPPLGSVQDGHVCTIGCCQGRVMELRVVRICVAKEGRRCCQGRVVELRAVKRGAMNEGWRCF